MDLFSRRYNEIIDEKEKEITVLQSRIDVLLQALRDCHPLLPHCPQCKSEIGLIQPREGSLYCEDCGWPDDDFGKEQD